MLVQCTKATILMAGGHDATTAVDKSAHYAHSPEFWRTDGTSLCKRLFTPAMEQAVPLRLKCLVWNGRTCFLPTSELVTAAFVASKEAAWRPAQTAVSVEWLGAHGYTVLGTELWLSKDGSKQSLP